MRRALALLVLPLATLLAPAAARAGSETVGDVQAHYNVFASGFLSQEQAQRYGVLRSRKRGVLVLSLRRDDQPLTARVHASATDGGGESRSILMREVREQGMVSYLGDFPFEEGESLRFAVEVRPDGGGPAFTLRFIQALYGD